MAFRKDTNHIYVSIDDLQKYIDYCKSKNISGDTEVVIQRIEDVYFNELGWEPIKLIFEQWSEKQEPVYSDYISCFQPRLKKDEKTGKWYLAIEAHY